jgi:hypothetical protein
MIILHSLAETYIFSFSFPLLLLGLLPYVSTTMLPASLFSSAASVLMTHNLVYIAGDTAALGGEVLLVKI